MATLVIALAPPASEDQRHRLLDLVLDRLSSPNSKIAYARALIDFLDWYDGQRRPPLSKGVVQRYRPLMLEAGLAPSSINQKLSAIRALAAEAADNGLLDRETAAAIK
jgi:site-specific recombinase XerD